MSFSESYGRLSKSLWLAAAGGALPSFAGRCLRRLISFSFCCGWTLPSRSSEAISPIRLVIGFGIKQDADSFVHQVFEQIGGHVEHSFVAPVPFADRAFGEGEA